MTRYPQHSRQVMRTFGLPGLSQAAQTNAETNFWTAITPILHRSGLFVLAAVMLALAPVLLRAQQVTATISGTVTDPKGALVQGAAVTIVDEATGSPRSTESNNDGTFSIPNLIPSTYSVKVVAQGFAPKELTGIEVHSGDEIRLPIFTLAVGATTDTVTVTSVAGQILSTENGQRTATLTYKDVQDLALEGRDTTELLKVLPGVVTITSNGVTGYNPAAETTGQSGIGNGLGINGAPYKGGTALNMDGAPILNVGDDYSSLAEINPEMTQELQVETSNFGADQASGPIVINSTSRSGGDHYHGEGYLNVRNDIFNANDWVDNHTIPVHPKAGAAYYYPGGSVSGPVPHTNKKLFFFGAFELPFQNQGNLNHLELSLPTPEMLGGDFSMDNPDNQILCPDGFINANGGGNVPFTNGAPGGSGNYAEGAWCQNISASPGNTYATILPDGSSPTPVAGNTAQGFSNGGIVPTKYIDPNMLAFTKVWPAWNSPYTAKTTQQIINNGGYNYFQPIVNIDNGWVVRGRIDYNWNSTNQAYIAYQQSFDSQLSGGASNCGESFYGGCATNTIQYPGGGITQKTYSKVLNGHYVHIFSATLTNEAIASWVFGNIPFVPINPSANFRSTLAPALETQCVYCANPKYMPTFGGVQGEWPGTTQADDWEPGNYYIVQKSIPTFADNLTKVWGRHTLKFGGMTSNTDNYQGNQTSPGIQGALTIGGNPSSNANIFANQTTPVYCSVCGTYSGPVGSYNPDVNLLTGNLTSYTEMSASPLSDVAFQTVAVYANDQIKINKQLSVEVGLRFEHIGWWYDRDGNGLAVFYPNRVLPDFEAGKYAPGFYWHAIDSGVPLSGRPNRFGFASPRFGLSYDLFGNGKTLVRGGWGAYRYQEASNGANNGSGNALTTAQGVQTFTASSSLPPVGNKAASFMISQINLLKAYAPNCQVQCAQGVAGGYSPADYGLPLNYAYNFTIDQRIPWGMLFEIGYVGNHAMHMSDNGQDGTSTTAYDNQNKTPVGAYFNPDPVTGVTACNPEKLNAPCSPKNSAYDYQPYGRLTSTGCSNGTNPNCLVYGANAVYMFQNNDYQNYNALQAQLVKRAGPVTVNANFTWDKSLGTVTTFDPFHISPNNTYDNLNRPFIFNSAYIYREPNFWHGNRFIGGAVNGWTISGISLWQKGTNGYPTISIVYDPATIPSSANATYGVSPGSGPFTVGQATFFGTNAGIVTGRPQLTCNPKSGLVYHQLYRPCFTAAQFGSSGGFGLPFVAGQAFLENDLALYKTFTIHEQNKVQFRVSAFNWLNHPLPTPAPSGESTTEFYYYSYTTHALYPNATCPLGTNIPNTTDSPSAGSCNPSGAPYLATSTYATPNENPADLFGQMHYKNGAGGNSQRVIELDIKYTF